MITVEMRFTLLLSRIFVPLTCFTAKLECVTIWPSLFKPEKRNVCISHQRGSKTLIKGKYFLNYLPEYCRVAPSKESIKLPRNPLNAPNKMIGHWGGA